MRKIKKLKEIAKDIRLKVVELLYRHRAAHLGSCLSSVEILVSLYFGGILGKNDKFLLSAGWKAAAFYSILAKKKIIDWKDLLKNYYQPGSKYWGLVHHQVRGVEHSFGSAGHGLPIGIGMALADKKKRVFVLMSDGEMDCGTTWEGALFAAHHKLDNLFVFVDYNKFQAFGKTNEVLNLEPLAKKWKDFGWDVYEIDGHSFEEIFDVFGKAKRKKGSPHIFICHTIKGKGVSFAENKLEWHYLNLTDKLYEKAKGDIYRGID